MLSSLKNVLTFGYHRKTKSGVKIKPRVLHYVILKSKDCNSLTNMCRDVSRNSEDGQFLGQIGPFLYINEAREAARDYAGLKGVTVSIEEFSLDKVLSQA